MERRRCRHHLKAQKPQDEGPERKLSLHFGSSKQNANTLETKVLEHSGKVTSISLAPGLSQGKSGLGTELVSAATYTYEPHACKQGKLRMLQGNHIIIISTSVEFILFEVIMIHLLIKALVLIGRLLGAEQRFELGWAAAAAAALDDKPAMEAASHQPLSQPVESSQAIEQLA